MFKVLQRMRIATKLWMLVVLFFVALVGVNVEEMFARKAQVFAEKQLKTRHLVETTFGILKQFQDAEKAGELTREQAQAGAIKTIKGLRYEDKEYFWINDLGRPVPKMIMHPTVPALDGKVLDEPRFNKATSQILGLDGKPEDVRGKNLFVAFVDVVDKAGHGFVLYDWPKPLAGGGASAELYTKLSYVKKFEPWGWVLGSGIYIDDVDASFWGAVRSQLVLGLVVLVVLGIVSWIIARGIIGPIDKTADALKSISEGEGDLTHRLQPAARGSMTRLAEGFNSFVARIEKTIVQVNVCTNRLASASEKVSGVAEHTSAGVQHQLEETQAVSAAVSEMSDRVQAVAQSAVSASQAAMQADAEARAGKTVVDETVASIRALATNVEQADAVITELSKESANIGGILDVIREIADQTNLLALNAAIEAARAGEQGRGFAVVADEVRVLAQRTQDSTLQIRKKIEALQKGAQAAATAMATSRGQAHVSVDQAASAGVSLEKITAAVAEITRINAHIASAAQEQAGVAEGINSSLHEIRDVAHQTAEDSNHTQTATGDLAALVGELQGLVRQFRISEQGFDFDAAISAHLTWKARLRSFLDGQTTLTREQAVSHRHCALGKWYYSEGVTRYGHLPAMKDIEPPHAELHKIIAEIVAAKERGNSDEAERLYARVEPLSKRIVGLLEQTRKQVAA